MTATHVFAENPLGSNKNPIRCDSPSGERWYLSRLIKENEKDLTWERLGSFGGGNGHILDGYKSNQGGMLFFDMYYYRYIEIEAPKGYRLLWEWSDKYEYVNGLIHLLNEKKAFTGKVEIKSDGVHIVGEIEKGLIKGKFTHYHENGKVKRTSIYNANRLEGKEVWYRANGKLWASYHYKKGLLHGLFQYYDEDGALKEEDNYAEGVPVQKEKKSNKAE